VEQTGGNADWVLFGCAPVIALVAAGKGLLPVGDDICPDPATQQNVRHAIDIRN
jgi:hypothetical protein